MFDRSIQTPLPLGKIPPISQARFWAFVDISGGIEACWPWRGTDGPRGYGWFQFDSQHYTATHVALALDGRGIPIGHHACHHCDNPSCCNPRHIFVGTQADNLLDRSLKGRATNQFTNATHCKKGHEYSSENTFIKIRAGRQFRVCVTCHEATRLRHSGRVKKMASVTPHA